MVDFQMSFLALSDAAHADIGAGAPLSPVRQFAAKKYKYKYKIYS